MDISLWKNITNFVNIDKYPQLPCPHCFKTSLALDQNSIQLRSIDQKTLEFGSRKFKEAKQASDTKKSQLIKDSGKSGSFWLELFKMGGYLLEEWNNPVNGKPYLLSGFFTCNSCKQSVAATGICLKPNQLNSDQKPKPASIKIEHFSPTVPITPISINVPEHIKSELLDAFKHFHFDPLSSASKLRRVIEQFCDNMEAKGKNLHQKICSLKATLPEETEYLEALKLLGNEGTHAYQVSELDLLHAFEITQFVLEVYDRKARYLKTKTNYQELVNKFGENKFHLMLPKLDSVALVEDMANKEIIK
jgi:hypothetical protein